MTEIKKRMTKADKILLLVFVVLSLLLYGLTRFYYSSPSTDSADFAERKVIIKVGGEIVKTIPFEEGTSAQRLMIEGKRGQAVIEIKDQGVRMLEAPCPDQICVKQGWLKSPGRSIICVPNEVVIYIDAEAPVDGVTQ